MVNEPIKEYGWPKEYNKKQGLRMVENIQRIKRTIPARFYNKTFTNFDKKENQGGFDSCLSYAKSFIDNLKTGQGLFITGNVGSGKTHLVVAIIDYIARILKRKESLQVIFITAIDLLSEIKYSYDKSNTEEIIGKLENCDLLVIDDLGIEKTTDWTHELFYKIIDSRYSNLLPVVITTNLTDSEIKEKLSERIISRIYEMCKGIKLTGKDYRLK